jgi:hypothetical protein
MSSTDFAGIVQACDVIAEPGPARMGDQNASKGKRKEKGRRKAGLSNRRISSGYQYFAMIGPPQR